MRSRDVVRRRLGLGLTGLGPQLHRLDQALGPLGLPVGVDPALFHDGVEEVLGEAVVLTHRRRHRQGDRLDDPARVGQGGAEVGLLDAGVDGAAQVLVEVLHLVDVDAAEVGDGAAPDDLGLRVAVAEQEPAGLAGARGHGRDQRLAPEEHQRQQGLDRLVGEQGAGGTEQRHTALPQGLADRLHDLGPQALGLAFDALVPVDLITGEHGGALDEVVGPHVLAPPVGAVDHHGEPGGERLGVVGDEVDVGLRHVEAGLAGAVLDGALGRLGHGGGDHHIAAVAATQRCRAALQVGHPQVREGGLQVTDVPGLGDGRGDHDRVATDAVHPLGAHGEHHLGLAEAHVVTGEGAAPAGEAHLHVLVGGGLVGQEGAHHAGNVDRCGRGEGGAGSEPGVVTETGGLGHRSRCSAGRSQDVGVEECHVVVSLSGWWKW